MTADTPDSVTDSPPPMPRWVRLLLVIAIVLFVLVVVLLLTGGHGPGAH